jgi:alpha-mannosidase
VEQSTVTQFQSAGGLVLHPTASWKQFQAELLSHFPQAQPNALADQLAENFAALGYGYLQVQMMTRQIRYTSNLDVAVFEEQVMKAAEAVVSDDHATARQMLQACFDTLGQERDHYYSNDAHLLDLTLLAESTLGKSLHQQLLSPVPTTLIASAQLLQQIEAKSAETLSVIRQRQSEGTLCIAGGLDRETPTPLQPRDTLIRALQRSPVAYRSLSLTAPKVFARLSFGLQEDVAGLLRRFDFSGVLLIPFTGGQYPTGHQPKISWESSDGARLPALASSALDTADPASFSAFGWRVGEALDRQHVPTLVLAHWPSGGCEFYDLLKIVVASTPALGKWQLADDYFDTTDNAFHHQRLEANGFSFNWLASSDAPGDLIAATKQTHKLQVRARSLLNIFNLAWQLDHLRSTPAWRRDERGDLVAPEYQPLAVADLHEPLARLLDGLDGLLEDAQKSTERYRQLQQLTSDIAQQGLTQLAKHLVKGKGSGPCKIIVNPLSSPVRTWVKTELDTSLASTEAWHYATGLVGRQRSTSVDLPSMGFVTSCLTDYSAATKDSFVLADASGMLRNEFSEAQIDLQRGHLRSLHIPARRGNRLSVMLAYRELDGKEVKYSEMVAKEVTMLTSSNMSGIIRSRGHFAWQGKSVGEFEIDYEIRRGSRIVAATISLQNLQFPEQHNPWRSAFVMRFAWPTEAAHLRVFQDGRRSSWSGGKTFSPELIEIDESDYCTHILTGGLAFHYRRDLRFAETLLAACGQHSVRHRVGFGVDLPSPMVTARQFIDKPHQITIPASPANSSGWLLTVDVKNVYADFESPLVDSAGNNVGARLTIGESAGKATTARMRVLRDVAEAHRVDYLGNRLNRLTASGDGVTIALRAGEQALVDLLWRVESAESALA